jgi:hypothetical protein
MNNFSELGRALRWAGLLLLMLGAAPALAQEQQQQQRAFATAEQAVQALIVALEKDDVADLAVLLGPGSEEVLSSGDAVADQQGRLDFLALYQAQHKLQADGVGQMSLLVGEQDWPLPIPLVKRGEQWFLDGAAGADELIYRRVGRNELGAIAVCRGFVDAQFDYAAQGHDGNSPGLFASKLLSDAGQQNGLYWPTAAGAPLSPAGPRVAAASAEGYQVVSGGERKPYHGYYYRMLFAQGSHAQGGAVEYFVDGFLSQGVALLAWPADYGVSGVKSFLINLDGTVYQQDLGENTRQRVKAIDSFDPDSSWLPLAAVDD